jgi:hypothetical protein
MFERLGLRTFSPTTFGSEVAYRAIFEPPEAGAAASD